jgi:hypothetical protein
MTEKQGGSDLRANATVARPLGSRGPGRPYLLNEYLTAVYTEPGTPSAEP